MLTWKFAKIDAIGWRWTGVIWLYNILSYMLLDPIKFAVRYALSGRAWGHVINRKVWKIVIQYSYIYFFFYEKKKSLDFSEPIKIW